MLVFLDGMNDWIVGFHDSPRVFFCRFFYEVFFSPIWRFPKDQYLFFHGLQNRLQHDSYFFFLVSHLSQIHGIGNHHQSYFTPVDVTQPLKVVFQNSDSYIRPSEGMNRTPPCSPLQLPFPENHRRPSPIFRDVGPTIPRL